MFERIVVVNLDRRADRLTAVTAQAERLGLSVERFVAVDGRSPEVEGAWWAYAEQPLATLPAGERAVVDYRQFYLDYDSEIARIAFLEQKEQVKALATPGAYGLLLSMTRLIERAIAKDWQSVLILEDDVLFHKDTEAFLERTTTQLPDDWLVLQLGAIQLHWDAGWISWHADNLYRCRGTSHGAHAVGLRREVLPLLLERCRALDLPFDIGALHTVKRRHAERCFTIYPNIAIQDASDTEIGMSRLFFSETRKPVNRYRWHYPDYGLAALDTVRRQRRNGTASDVAATADIATPAERATTDRLSWFKRLLRPKATLTEPPPPEDSIPTKQPARRLFDLPPLQPFAKDRPDAPRILVLAVGLETDGLEQVARMLAEQQRLAGVIPICVIVHDRFDVLRSTGLVFEYLPPSRLHGRAPAALDWELYELRRLWLLRCKWQPARIVAFGPASAQLVKRWRQSPFEDDSLQDLTRGVAEDSDSVIDAGEPVQ